MKYKVGDLLRYSIEYRTEKSDCIIEVTKVINHESVMGKIIEKIGKGWNESLPFWLEYMEPYKVPYIEEFL